MRPDLHHARSTFDSAGAGLHAYPSAWRTGSSWLALIALLVVPPCLSSQSWLLAYLAQTASMIVFALSWNLLLGETGLLSFGHAAFAGLGALVAAHLFNRHGIALPWLPFAGGIGGALAGAIAGLVATRRAGTAFAMITLGIGELVAAAAWSLPDWFGGEAGVAIDRASGPAWGTFTFGPAREAYAVIVCWCLLATFAMWTLSRTPFVRLANAVRDNPVRAASTGCDPRRVRYRMFVLSSFFAGIAGTLGLVNVELVSTESVGMLRSGSVLIATVMGGSGAFFGPVVGAVVLVFFSAAIASVTHAWLFYLGLLFIVIVVRSPDGIAGLVALVAAHLRRYGWRASSRGVVFDICAGMTWTFAIVLAVQYAYALQSADETGGRVLMAGAPAIDTTARIATTCVVIVALALTGWWMSRRAQREWAHLEAHRGATAAAKAVAGANINSEPRTTPIASITSGMKAGAPAIVLRGVEKSVDGTAILRGVDLTIAAGERHALIGPNGAGKSTLFNLIAGAGRASAGRIEINGIDTTRSTPSAISRGGVARSFQTTSVFGRLTVFDNLRCAVLAANGEGVRWWHRWLPARAVDVRVERVLEAVGLASRRHVFAGTLSYAEQRALDLGIALAGGAPTLLLDEPTAGMNRAEAARAIELIREATRGRTLLMIEHDMDAVFGLADRVSVIVQGCVIATGTPEAIRADRNVRAAYLGEDPAR
ncbi:branched-chain amino acid ABC transporter ATP-binding protein/permease [Paraburkholderia saeva]|uniref:branched-chain amino acid ABC transporter ATP-binding protein/permease n=1 Tax=Paraburkholderia saeva TaxID=2777537 RepID=UPI001DD47076|nr:branched-chain amino acid ABC transporter ATP-binding protein/permease [Paraburkholderia saeva]CAG4910002.1 Vitamin B12 import ATP-binding protein BtuD [Paraburkholderia saeva]CAG4921284.1 Vitamin B12 import ATP-binding protein BtuD [Paraburkholderia saeva]